MPQAPAPASATWVIPWEEAAGEERARTHFSEVFGGDPQVVLSAPGMVSLIGDHTDYNHGLSLATLLSHRIYLAAKLRADGRVRVAIDPTGEHEGATSWKADLGTLHPHGTSGWARRIVAVLWALQERGYGGPGFDMALVSCVPHRMGMASSAAKSAAVALGVSALWGLSLDTRTGRAELAAACVDGEAAFVGPRDGGAPSGGLDLHTSLRCPPGEALRLDFRTEPPATQDTPLYLPDYGLTLLIIDTQARVPSPTETARHRRQECARAAQELGVANLRDLEDLPDPWGLVKALSDPVLQDRARHVLAENERVRTVAGELSGTGPASERFRVVGEELYQSHLSLSRQFDLGSHVLDVTVDLAMDAGALGAHLLGWGRGGAIVALVRRDNVARLAEAMGRAYAQRGWAPPRFAAML